MTIGYQCGLIIYMLPSNPTGLIIVLLAIVPGYIATTFWARNKTWKGHSTDLLTILQSIAVSAVIQVIAAPLTLATILPYSQHLDRYETRVAAWLALVVLVMPIVLGTCAAALANAVYDRNTWLNKGLVDFARRVAPAPPPPSMWDWLFT